MKPAVSIITPSYNRADLLPRVWNSIKRQTEQNFQWIVVDDGSTDHTAEVIGGFDDTRIHYIRQQNTGVGGARNRGEREVHADYVIFLDSDDELFSATTLEEMLGEIRRADVEVGQVYFTVVDSHSGRTVSYLEKDRMTVSYADRACEKKIHGEFIMIFRPEALSASSWPPYNGMESLRLWRILREHRALAVNRHGRIYHREYDDSLTGPRQTICRAKQMAQATIQLIDENRTTWLAHCPCQLGRYHFYRAMYLILCETAFNAIPDILFALRWGAWNIRCKAVALVFSLPFPRFIRQKIFLLRHALTTTRWRQHRKPDTTGSS